LPIITKPNKNFCFMFSYIEMYFIIVDFNIIIECPFMPPTIRWYIRYTIMSYLKQGIVFLSNKTKIIFTKKTPR
jgi:hypothetical protein